MAAISLARAPSCLRLASPELETDTVNGFDDIVAIDSGKLGADVANVAVDGAVGDLDVELIGGVHDLLATENHRGPRQERPQDSKFDGGQAQREAGELRDMLFGIDRKLALGKRRRFLCVRPAGHAAQNDVNAGNEFARAEGFGDVIVAADLKAEHAVDLVVARRKKQDRNVGGLANFPA